MKFRLLLLFISVLGIIVSCTNDKSKENKFNNKVSNLLYKNELLKIKKNLKTRDSIIRINLDSSDNSISISEINYFFVDTNICSKPFPWIEKIFRYKINYIINKAPYTSFLYVFFIDSLTDDKINAFCSKISFSRKTSSSNFTEFYAGKNAIILHDFYIERLVKQVYMTSILDIVEEGILECGYKKYNATLRKYVTLN